jgi:hypothetical protein
LFYAPVEENMYPLSQIWPRCQTWDRRTIKERLSKQFYAAIPQMENLVATLRSVSLGAFVGVATALSDDFDFPIDISGVCGFLRN